MSDVTLSIVIVSYNASRTIARCLASLDQQTVKSGFEIVAVDSSTDDTAAIIAAGFPAVGLHTFATRKYPGDARNYAIAQARGNLIAFIDADCVASPDWVAQLLAAHRSDKAVIGGVVDNANPEDLVGWVYYFCEFTSWMPGSKPGAVEEIPTCCLSFKREMFDRYGPFLEGTYCSYTAFHWRMARDGHRPWLDPAIRIAHINPTRLWALLRHEIQHGRYFASVRAKEQAFSTSRCLIYIVAAPLLPFLIFARAAACVFKSGRYRGRFLLVAPLVLLGKMAWSWGELLGYLRAVRKPQGNRI
jgi:glycosyltransferase involved in cell wall biosynthesis